MRHGLHLLRSIDRTGWAGIAGNLSVSYDEVDLFMSYVCILAAQGRDLEHSDVGEDLRRYFLDQLTF